MDLGTALLIGGAIANNRVAGDQRRPRVCDGFCHRTFDIVKIMTVAFHHMPSGGGIAGRDIFA